jgi:hypothetical protein
MTSYFARTPRRRKPVRWQMSPAVARLVGMPAKPKRKLKTEEHDAQCDLFKDDIWPRLVVGAVAFAVGNGGKRHPKVAKAMKEEGVTAGVPDIFVLHARQVYFLEMKKPRGGRVSKDQKIMMARLVGAGAICAVAAGLEQAIQQLEAWRLLEVAVATAEQGMAA